MIWPFNRLTLFLCLLLGSLQLYHLNRVRSLRFIELTNIDREFDWESLVGSDDLVWVKCSEARECARLNVPLNYSDPDGELATIALIRVPAPLPSLDSSEYRGPILFNPGGPGGSGVDLIAGPRGELFSQIVGPQFDIVGFDPRGLGRSTPQVAFFNSSAERALWLPGALNTVNATSEHLPQAWARAQISSHLAREHDSGFLRHINTDNTARDMLRIAQAHGQDKLKYWGFSYGTILGATYAAMFPDFIERLVIDGVADAENYYATLWSNNLLDTDKTLQAFFDGCAEAGPDRCAFYAPTAAAISQNLSALYDSIRAHPIPTYSDGAYGVIDYSKLRSTIFLALYSPYAQFSKLASALAHLAAGDGAELLRLYNQPIFECKCNPSSNDLYGNSFEGGTAIRCTDGKEVKDSIEEFETYFEKMAEMSNWADIWAGIRIGCSSWPIQRGDHFTGPFVGNTSYPMLIIGNTADPVTPLWAAKKTSTGFPGSIVLTQDSPGHCSISAPSVCTQKYIQQYFQKGTLPDANTTCGMDGDLFPKRPSSLVVEGEVDVVSADLDLSPEDRNLLNAARALGRLGAFRGDFHL